jgi:hypothetical protein
MGIGPDIAEVIQEIGTAFTIVRDSGNITGEYLDFDPNTQVTKPFIREFFLEIMLSYQTLAESGDVIEFDVPGDRYLLMNKTPDMFENEIIKNDGVIYKCNVSGELFRPSGESDWNDQTYRRPEHFELIKANCYALLTTPMHGGELEEDEPIGLIEPENQELFIPSSIGIQVLDRYQPKSGEYYRINAVKKRRYPNVDVALLGEDTRHT